MGEPNDPPPPPPPLLPPPPPEDEFTLQAMPEALYHVEQLGEVLSLPVAVATQNWQAND